MEAAGGGYAMKVRVSPKGHFWACGLLSVFAWIALGPLSAQATITEIIDATGDGGGHTFSYAHGIAVRGSGNVYVTGGNAFKITPGGAGAEVPALSMQGSAVLVVLLLGAALIVRARGRRLLDPSRRAGKNTFSAAR